MRQLPHLSAAERTNEWTNLVKYEIIRFKCLGADTKGIEQKWKKKRVEMEEKKSRNGEKKQD